MMATTSLWRVKSPISGTLEYVKNKDKTEIKEKKDALNALIAYAGREEATNQRQLVSGLNCTPDRAVHEMQAVKALFYRENGTLAYHGYQSFKEGEVTPEAAHEIGKKLAEELWGDRFQVIVATHVDKQSHLHNHFVINTVSYVDGKKFHRTRQDYLRMRNTSDRLCREYGLSVIKDPIGKGDCYNMWMAEKNGKPTYRSIIRADIDRAVRASLTEAEFFARLRKAGYEFRFYSDLGKELERPSLKPKGAERFFRFDRLGEDYSLEEIRGRILENTSRSGPFPEEELQAARKYRNSHPPHTKAKGIAALYYYYCYQLKIIVKYPAAVRTISASMRADILKLEKLDEEVRFLAVNRIETEEDLLEYKMVGLERKTFLSELKEQTEKRSFFGR